MMIRRIKMKRINKGTNFRKSKIDIQRVLKKNNDLINSIKQTLSEEEIFDCIKQNMKNNRT